MTKVEKIHRHINDTFRDHLKNAMAEEGVKIESEWNFFIDRLVTRTVDGKDMMPEQMQFLKGYSKGYLSAMRQILLD